MTDRRSRRTNRRRRAKRRRIIFAIVALILLAIIAIVLFSNFAYVLRPVDNDRKNMVGLYAEPNNSLDMIYLGASSVYAGWSPLQAYNENGMASYSLAAQGMPASVIKNAIIETEKSQDPEVYVVDISPFMQMNTDKEYSLKHIKRISNSMKYSYNRYDAIKNFSKYSMKDMTLKETVAVNVDIIPNRHNIGKVTDESQEYQNNHIKSDYKGFRLRAYKTVNLPSPDDIRKSDASADLSSDTYAVLDDLLKYANDEELNILFTYVPRELTEVTKPIYNALEGYISDNGYEFYDSVDKYKDMDIDYSRDFYNGNHLNYIGAAKYTDYFADYLMGKYSLPDRRNDDDYKDWSENFVGYTADVKDIVYSLGLVDGDILYAIRPVTNNRRGMIGIYAEPSNSLDMIFIGASSVYRSWSPLQAWHERGFTSYSYGIAGTPASAITHLLTEAEKTQDPELYVIDISAFMQISDDKNYSRDHLFRLTNSLNYSANRSMLIDSVEKYNLTDLSDEEIQEYEFDVLTNEGNAANLSDGSLVYKNNSVPSPYKGYRLDDKGPKALSLPTGIKDNTSTTDIDDTTYELLDTLFVQIKKDKLNVLFTYPPRYVDSTTKPIYNTIAEYIKKNGFEYYDSMGRVYEMGIDYSTDLYNKNHLDYLGSVKYTKYFGKYLSKKYKLEDKRNDNEYKSWNDLYSVYKVKAEEIERTF